MKKLIFFTSFFFYSIICFGQSGELDLSFGNQGLVKTDMGSPFNYKNFGKQVLIEADGSMYLIIEVPDSLTNRNLPWGLTVITKRHSDGSTDLSYGKNGYSVTVPIYASHATLQRDGKIVVIGSSLNSDLYFYNHSNFAVTRFNTDGSLDNTFGKNGIQITDVGDNDYANAVAIQNDGKIVVAGINITSSGAEYFVTVRYNIDGSVDRQFSANFDFVAVVSSIAIQSDGKIVIGGNLLLRYDSTGILDSTFNGDGHQPYSDVFNAIAIGSDGKILAAGRDFSLSRYNANGTLDSTFGVNGIHTTNFDGDVATATCMTIGSTGKIILGGYTGVADINFAIACFNSDGILDSSFSNDGKQITNITSGSDYVNSMAIDGYGKLLAFGYNVSGANTYIAAARYDTFGNLDNSFHGDGILTDHITQGSTFYTSSAIQNDGKVLSAGYTWNNDNYDFVVARYNPDGSLDSTFSGDGRQTTDFGSTDDRATAMMLQSDGKILVAGSAGEKSALARYNPDGSPDISFGSNAIQITDFDSQYNTASLALQSDGKIVVGTSSLARYNTDGSLDRDFDGDGKVTLHLKYNAVAVPAIQSDNKIVLIGTDGSTGLLSVIRYNINGSIDSTFHYEIPPFDQGPLTHVFGTSIAIQNDGMIVIGGNYIYRYMTTSSQFALMRLKIDGTVDSTLNGTGLSVVSINHAAYATSLTIQNDNKIVLSGYSDNGSSDDFAIVKFNYDGTFDNTFNSDGIVLTQASSAYDRIGAIAVFNDKLYAVGYGQYPGYFGVIARYTLTEGGPLPVSLLNFTGFLQNNSVLLQWEIATQKNITSFVIERSGNGNRFFPINSIEASAINAFPGNYSIIDEKPLQGINFYRLKLVDADGKFIYSNIIAVKMETGNKLWIFPNPANRVLFVEVNGNNENALVQIVDLNGRKLKERKVFLDGTTSFSLDISSLSRGIYNLILLSNRTKAVQRFVKE